ncbi:MAG: ribonuclease P protein component [Lunatimonas sp.]|uniref:ribonuclease P protein component n=1 Tax=Lunatimonas sp. TaxID=2060141 RepID=UPI00263B1E95|nr:ribonuclease P protein component [Lunatimonas sp.]MCC5937239.1 ribonuclease P protein component [Lunatimonas sp.]
MDRKFPKSERLHSRKSIKELFDKSSSFFLYPFKVIFLASESVGTDQVLISVSKKKLRKATDRNWVKRRVREAYRLNKHLLAEKSGPHKHIGLIYVSSDLIAYDEISKKIATILKKLNKL